MAENKRKTRSEARGQVSAGSGGEAEWPVLARGSWSRSDVLRSRAWAIDIEVRRRPDRYVVVSASYNFETCFMREVAEGHRVGVLLDMGADIAAGVDRAADELMRYISDGTMHPHVREAAAEAVSRLPTV